MVRRLRGPERKKDGKVKRFLRYTALTASLMAGCAGGTANKPTLGNARPPLTNPGAGIAVKCKGTKSLAVGQEMWFGVTWRSYGMRVITFDEKSVIVDMTVPATISSKDSDKLKAVAVRFNGVEMPRKLLEMVLRAACSSQSEAKSLLGEFTGPDGAAKPETVPKAAERRPVRVKDDSKAIEAKINAEGILTKIVVNMLDGWYSESDAPKDGRRLPMSETGKPAPMKLPVLAVVRSDENEFVLKVVGGPHDDKRLRLDRRLELSVETFSDKAVKVTEVQYRIVSLTSDSKGKLKATLSLASKTGTTYPY